MTTIQDRYDAIIVGGGPAGTVAAMYLRRAGKSVLVLEKARHPRFCVGESLLPATNPIWDELGLTDEFEAAGFLKKYGAYFAPAADDDRGVFPFPEAERAIHPYAYQVPRDAFDKILWDAAVRSGADCVDLCTVKRFTMEGDRCVGVDLVTEGGDARAVTARIVFDCTGRRTMLANQLGIRTKDPNLDRVCLFTHYRGVTRDAGDDEGTIAIVAQDYGWGWLIPFAGDTASLGMVVEREWFDSLKKAKIGRDGIWERCMADTPALANRLVDAEQIRPVSIVADYSYRAAAIAGNGWVLVGDSAAFLDPVFSSGVHLAVTSAKVATAEAIAALDGDRPITARHFAKYAAKVKETLHVFSHFIYAWNDPYFRALFLTQPAEGPVVGRMRREVVSMLAGNVWPSWRVMPWFYAMQGVAKMNRWRDPGDLGLAGARSAEVVAEGPAPTI